MPMVKWFLWPFSLLYLIITACRNLLYDFGVLSSKKAGINTLVIGNLAIGGSGKTPLTMYLAEELKQNNQIAILSRGYGRSTTGFKWVHVDSSYRNVGDEPLMMKINNPELPVAVCENRITGLEKIQSKYPKVKWVLLDDGFQHRKLQPSFSLIVSDYNRPYFKDFLLPMGSLRESKSQIRRADALVFTKVPHPFQKYPDVRVPSFYFHQDYLPLKWVKGERPNQKEPVVTIAGIAKSRGFFQQILKSFPNAEFKKFSDHYPFNQKDLNKIMPDEKKLSLVTTEKDWVRIKELNLTRFENIAFLPLKLNGDASKLLKMIENHNDKA